MSVVHLDSGALIALDRGDRRMRARLVAGAQGDIGFATSAIAVAQAWRDPQRQRALAGALSAIEIIDVTEALARLAGRALAATRTSDVADALIAATAATAGALLLTDDLDDMTALQAGFFGGLRLGSVGG